MTYPTMISVDAAFDLIAASAAHTPPETLPLDQSAGRRLAAPVIAQVTQPPAAVSAMDGYAVRHADIGQQDSFTLIGEAPAGSPFKGKVDPGQCVRIFTGSVMPDGTDHVVIQEDVDASGETIRITDTQSDQPAHVRRAGIDFSSGDELLSVGALLDGHALALAAAANVAELTTFTPPRIGILANGDELRLPGETPGDGDVVCSTPFGLAELIRNWGGEPVFTGIARDSVDDIKRVVADMGDLDIIVPLGGASVGDHDHMKAAFGEMGLETIFSKIKVKPGKPTWFGRLDQALVLGLPGNPASALVCAHLFLRRLVEAMSGAPSANRPAIKARLASPMKAEGGRDNFMRATLVFSADGVVEVTPARAQDSSLLRPFGASNVLLHRPANAGAAAQGELVDCFWLD